LPKALKTRKISRKKKKVGKREDINAGSRRRQKKHVGGSVKSEFFGKGVRKGGIQFMVGGARQRREGGKELSF